MFLGYGGIWALRFGFVLTSDWLGKLCFGDFGGVGWFSFRCCCEFDLFCVSVVTVDLLVLGISWI